MMQKTVVFIITILLFSCNEKKSVPEQAIFDRIEFVFNLKDAVNESDWKSFTDQQFDVPLIYFTDSSSYVANPTNKFISTFKSALVYETRGLKIYKTDKRIDSLPFHMETGMTLGTPTDEYNYHSPFMKCSSFEEAKKNIPPLQSTEQWATMIMHEYFHGFQYKHAGYIKYYEDHIADIQPDSLTAVYNHNSWFKNSIDRENDLLLQANAEPDALKTNMLVDSFFIVRKQRRLMTNQQLQLDIEKYEACYETMEGTARYIEYNLYQKFSTGRPDYKLVKSDSSYKRFNQYRNYNIEKDKWLYKSSKTTYFYATGFNMARLLDKLNLEYKTRLFNEGALTMEEILKHR